jgi:hypothetical protein
MLKWEISKYAASQHIYNSLKTTNKEIQVNYKSNVRIYTKKLFELVFNLGIKMVL